MQHLKDLKIRFSSWRAEKLTLAEPVPKELWQEVKIALKSISSGLLCRELGITYHQMRLHCDFVRSQLKPNNYCGEFVEIAPTNKNPALNQDSHASIVTSPILETCEVLLTINNHPVTIKLPTTNLPTALQNIKTVL